MSEKNDEQSINRRRENPTASLKKKYAVNIVPLHGESDTVLKHLFLSRQGHIKTLMKHGIRIFMVVQAETTENNMREVLNYVGGHADISLIEHIRGIDISDRGVYNMEEINIMQIYQEFNQINQLIKELGDEGITQKQKISINIDNPHGLPNSCLSCSNLSAIQNRMNKDETIINTLNTQMLNMQNNIASMFQKLNPDINFDATKEKSVDEIPSKYALEIWFTLLRNSKTIQDFNQALNDVDILGKYKDSHTEESDDFKDLVSSLHSHASEILLLLEAVLSCNANSSSEITKNEKKILNSSISTLRSDVSNIAKLIKDKCGSVE